MQFKRYAMLALAAMTLTACGSDDPSGPGGLSNAQRFAEAARYNEAVSHALSAGAEESATGFLYIGFGYLFGTGSADVTMSSNGMALRAAGPTIASAVAGSYEAFAISWTDIEINGEGSFEYDMDMILAYRDTTNLVGVVSYDGAPGSFVTTDTYGAIYESGKEWLASTGSASLTNMDLDGECDIDAALRAAIETELEDTEGTTSFTCHNATFDASVNITGSAPNENTAATGSRTASFSRTGLPGLRIVVTYDYTGIAR